MGREVRKVSSDWEHPKENNRYKPLHEYCFYENTLKEWKEEAAKNGEQSAIDNYDNCPDINDYMPKWDESELTHIMMYEDTSEGTPESPKFEVGKEKELAKWLADNNASWFGDSTATYEQWLGMIDANFRIHQVGNIAFM